jgi:hypothetical protein
MSAETITMGSDRARRRLPMHDDQALLLRVVLLVTAGLAAGVGLVLLTRRWSEALEQPLNSAGLLMLAGVLGVLAVCVRVLWRIAERGQDISRPGWRYAFDTTLTVGLLGLAAAVSLPQSPVLPVAALWLVIVACEGTTWFLRLRSDWTRRGASDPLGSDSPPCDAPTLGDADQGHGDVSLRPGSTAVSEDEESWETLPAEVSQRITRATDEDGRELVYGIVRCEFAPQQRQQNVHLAFCPPLALRPQLSVDQVDGPTASIRSTVIETFGAGIEIKLKAARSVPTSVQIQFYACEQTDSDAI